MPCGHNRKEFSVVSYQWSENPRVRDQSVATLGCGGSPLRGTAVGTDGDHGTMKPSPLAIGAARNTWNSESYKETQNKQARQLPTWCLGLNWLSDGAPSEGRLRWSKDLCLCASLSSLWRSSSAHPPLLKHVHGTGAGCRWRSLCVFQGRGQELTGCVLHSIPAIPQLPFLPLPGFANTPPERRPDLVRGCGEYLTGCDESWIDNSGCG